MTDVRLPERWLNDRRLLRLSDPAFRLFVTALAWSVANRTDGALDDADLSLIPRADAGCANELVTAGLWRHHRDTWFIADFAVTQTSAHDLEVLENARRRDREKKARQRASKRDSAEGASPGTVPRDSTGQDRQGQDRQLEEPPTDIAYADSSDLSDHEPWPTTALVPDMSWSDALYDRER